MRDEGRGARLSVPVKEEEFESIKATLWCSDSLEVVVKGLDYTSLF